MVLLNIFLISLITQLPVPNRIANHLEEQLNYSMEFLNLPAGTIDFNVTAVEHIDSTDVYHLIVTAKTNKIFSPLFKVQNKYESFFDTTSFLPLILKKDIEQKNIHQRLIINFDHKQQKASFSDSVSWSIPDSCYSFFSMLYFLRNQTYLKNDTIQFYLDSENLPSEGRAVFTEKKIISIPAGKFKAIEVHLQFEPLTSISRPWKTDLLTNRLANPNSKITIWFSDDKHRLPLIIKFEQKGFDVKLVLKQFKIMNTE